MKAFHAILREHASMQDTDFDIRVLARWLVWPDQAGNFAARRRILEEFLRFFAFSSITEEMLKEPAVESATTP